MESTNRFESDGIPQSQRMTLPTPPPVAVLADQAKKPSALKPSVGSYLIVNEGAVERRRALVSRSGPRS